MEQDNCFELVMRMRSTSLQRETDMSLRVKHGASAMDTASKVANAYGATVVSLSYEDGRPYVETMRDELGPETASANN